MESTNATTIDGTSVRHFEVATTTESASSNLNQISTDNGVPSSNDMMTANNAEPPNTANVSPAASQAELSPQSATAQLTNGLMQMFEPPISKARGQLKELIGRQNKLYIDLSHQKYTFDQPECARIIAMMQNVKIYRAKLLKLRKQLQKSYYRSDGLKKRAANVLSAKQKELQRRRQREQREEALIGNQQQQQPQEPPQPEEEQEQMTLQHQQAVDCQPDAEAQRMEQ